MLNDREIELAWALADMVGDGIPAGDRHSLFITLGLGEIAAAIRMLLVHVVEQRISLSTEIFLEVRSWSQFHQGSLDQVGLAALLDRVCVD